VQHKEWLADIAIFEKANPNITINSVYNYPCDAVTGAVHRDAARRDRDEPLLRLFH